MFWCFILQSLVVTICTTSCNVKITLHFAKGVHKWFFKGPQKTRFSSYRALIAWFLGVNCKVNMASCGNHIRCQPARPSVRPSLIDYRRLNRFPDLHETHYSNSLQKLSSQPECRKTLRSQTLHKGGSEDLPTLSV